MSSFHFISFKWSNANPSSSESSERDIRREKVKLLLEGILTNVASKEQVPISGGNFRKAAAPSGNVASQGWVIFIVLLALFLDNVLLSTVGTIIPKHLYAGNNYPDSLQSNETNSSVLTTDGATVLPVDNGTEQPPQQDIFDEEKYNICSMFGYKNLVQLVVIPIVGKWSNGGHEIPMFFGFFSMFISATIFAYARFYADFFVASLIQGVGSALFAVSGFGMLADRFPNEKQRGAAMGLALAASAFGAAIGPIYGIAMYEMYGKTWPFYVLALVAGVVCLLQTLMRPSVRRAQVPSYDALFQDKYIWIVAGSIAIANLGFTMLYSSLPVLTVDQLHLPKGQLGAALIYMFLFYCIGALLLGAYGYELGRGFGAMLGFVIIIFCSICIQWVKTSGQLIGATGALGFALGMVNSCLMPELGRLIDTRQNRGYGTVFAIAAMATSLGYTFGPELSDYLVKCWGFEWMLVAIAIIHLVYAPLLFNLKCQVPPRRNGLTVVC